MAGGGGAVVEGCSMCFLCPLCVMASIIVALYQFHAWGRRRIRNRYFWCNLHFNKAVRPNRTSLGHVTFNNIQYLYIPQYSGCGILSFTKWHDIRPIFLPPLISSTPHPLPPFNSFFISLMSCPAISFHVSWSCADTEHLISMLLWCVPNRTENFYYYYNPVK